MVTNLCKCGKDHGYTTVTACNKCGFINDPVWPERAKKTTAPIDEGQTLMMIHRMIDLGWQFQKIEIINNFRYATPTDPEYVEGMEAEIPDGSFYIVITGRK